MDNPTVFDNVGKLRLRDYLNMPIVELADHPDFDEKFFWLASELSDAPMRELEKGIDHEWVRSINS